MKKESYRITFIRIGHRLQPCQTVIEATSVEKVQEKFFAYFSAKKYELQKVVLIEKPFDLSRSPIAKGKQTDII